jgi:TRAP-type C4-dicarboxylate transport system permease large subunit
MPATTCGSPRRDHRGRTLGILIPPSVMIIVYAAVAGQSVVKLYASAMFPGFFLAFLYLVYIDRLGAHQPEGGAQAARIRDACPTPDWVRGCRRRIRATWR